MIGRTKRLYNSYDTYWLFIVNKVFAHKEHPNRGNPTTSDEQMFIATSQIRKTTGIKEIRWGDNKFNYPYSVSLLSKITQCPLSREL